MFVGILLHDSARDFNVEIQSSRHREIFEISSRAVQKLQGATLSPAMFHVNITFKPSHVPWKTSPQLFWPAV